MINGFKGEYRFLSNFWPSPINVAGVEYPTVEHAYQAEKACTIEDREYIRKMSTPGKAKRAGAKVLLRTDWDQIRLQVMFKLLILKFSQNKELGDKLLATGDEELVEENDWGDTFWGVCNGEGHNFLGIVLMDVRHLLSVSIR